MTKDFVRKCSHCGHNGHNSRTCNGKGCIKLFGVKIDSLPSNGNTIRRTRSLDSLPSFAAESSAAAASGYLSDSPDANGKRKGKPWTEDEHRSFLIGLEHIGKGDWRGISKKYVPTRTPTQVASHAQKYFLRMATLEKNKRRSSVFDIGINESSADPPPNEPISNESSHESELTLPLFQGRTPDANLAIKKSGETTTNVVPSSDRPPLSPSMRYNNGCLNYYRMASCMVGPSSSTRPSFSYVRMTNPPAACPSRILRPSFSYVRMMNPPTACRPQILYHQAMQPPLPSDLPMRPCTRPLMLIPPSGDSVLRRHHQTAPPPATMMSSSNKDGFDLSLGALTL